VRVFYQTITWIISNPNSIHIILFIIFILKYDIFYDDNIGTHWRDVFKLRKLFIVIDIVNIYCLFFRIMFEINKIKWKERETK